MPGLAFEELCRPLRRSFGLLWFAVPGFWGISQPIIQDGSDVVVNFSTHAGRCAMFDDLTSMALFIAHELC
jgi:hypothetical protein